MMIDLIYNARQEELPVVEHSKEWENLRIQLENTLTDKQIELLHAMLDIQSDTAADEMRAAYKAGFMDSMNLIKEIMG